MTYKVSQSAEDEAWEITTRTLDIREKGQNVFLRWCTSQNWSEPAGKVTLAMLSTANQS